MMKHHQNLILVLSIVLLSFFFSRTSVVAAYTSPFQKFVEGLYDGQTPALAKADKRRLKKKLPKQQHQTYRENIFENELGAQPPLGFWDPLGIVADGNRVKFERLRYVEIKHGRICMLAVVGYLVTAAGLRVPAFDGLPAGFDAITSVPDVGLYQVLFFIGILETEVVKDVAGTAEFDGDFRNGFTDPGWDTFDEATKLQKRAIELNQGRAAMMGILGLMVHEKMGNVDAILPLHL